MKNNTYKIALFGVLSAVALTLSYLEGLIPTVAFMPPGAKMGFSNIATMFAASSMGIVSALAITFIKALFAGITRGVTAFFMSLCGGILSTVTMYLLFKLSKKTGYMAIGIICALVHNFGQLIVAIITAGNLSVLGYAPVLLISGTVTGAVTGTVLRAVMPALEKVTETITRKGGK
ncbi:MAG: Gx transporter family protein [Oscillospiraceae bacterium]|nr:Gx transporter family protein [Oscillospiraceae bacterium]MDD6271602.1 Gx transporter family protein [Ruminococcus sp.]